MLWDRTIHSTHPKAFHPSVRLFLSTGSSRYGRWQSREMLSTDKRIATHVNLNIVLFRTLKHWAEPMLAVFPNYPGSCPNCSNSECCKVARVMYCLLFSECVSQRTSMILFGPRCTCVTFSLADHLLCALCCWTLWIQVA